MNIWGDADACGQATQVAVRRNILAAGLSLPLLGACSTTDVLAALTRFGGAIDQNISYGPNARHKLDVYRAEPSEAAKTGRATVLFFYGGSWNRGDRGDYRFVGRSLAAKGLTTVVADYRLYPEVRYPEFLEDSAMAANWTLREAAKLGGDTKRVFVMGHSAGAYNAAMLALDPRWLGKFGASPQQWAGWIGMAGPYEFLPMTNVDAQPVFFHPNYPPNTQPIELVSAQAPRTLLITANKDVLVNPKRNSAALAARLQRLNVPVRHEQFDRVDHQTLIAALASPLLWLAPVADAIVDFVREPAS